MYCGDFVIFNSYGGEIMEFHGGTWREDLLDFSISVNPYTPKWKDEIFKRCSKLSKRYTYVEWIEEKFKRVFGDHTVITAGATEAFQILGFTLMKDANVIIPMPSYGEYERVAEFRASKITKIPPKGLDLNLEMAFDTAEKSQKNEKTVLIFANPTNPVGKYSKNLNEQIKSLTQKGVIVVIDETFLDFVENAIDITNPQVIRVRSFTKSYGMPGIRVGYVITQEFERLFRKHRAPWAIGACGYAFLNLVIEDGGAFLEESIPKIRKEAVRFEKIQMKTDVNFGCIYVGDAKRVQKELDELGVHVRNCESFGLKGYIRVSVRTPTENNMLFENLEKVNL